MNSSHNLEDTPKLGEKSRDVGSGFEGFGRLEVRSRRLEMPIFKGDDLDGWVFRVEDILL